MFNSLEHLTASPIFQQEGVVIEFSKAFGSAALSLGLTIGANVAIPWNNPTNIALRIGGTGLAASAALYGLRKTRQLQLAEHVIATRQVVRNDLVTHKVVQLAPELYAGEQELLQPVLEPVQPNFFDWKLFNTKPSKYAHIGFLGPTGDGKTLTSEWANTWLDGNSIVVAPHWKPGDWPNQIVYGAGRNYGGDDDLEVNFKDLVTGNLPKDPETGVYKISAATVMKTLLVEMDRRYKLILTNSEDWDCVTNVFLDEYLAIADVFKGAADILLKLLREARKVGIRLILLLQGKEVKALKIEGQGSVRDCIRFVRLGSFAKDHAKQLKDETIIDWLKNQGDYGYAMVEEELAFIPDLTEFERRKSEYVRQYKANFQRQVYTPIPPVTPTVTPEVERLERLYSLECTENTPDDTPNTPDQKFDAFCPNITPEEIHRVIAKWKESSKQDDILKEVYSASKSAKSKRYRVARRRFRRILNMKEIELPGTPWGKDEDDFKELLDDL